MNKEFIWTKDHRYIASVRSSMDGYFYINLYEVEKPMVSLKIYGSTAHDKKWAFIQALKELQKTN